MLKDIKNKRNILRKHLTENINLQIFHPDQFVGENFFNISIGNFKPLLGYRTSRKTYLLDIYKEINMV